MVTRFALTLVLVLLCAPAGAAVQTRDISYTDGEVELRGHLAWDDAIEGRRPGVIVVHEWWGLNDYARRRAEQLAELGYTAFAVDMYGKDKVTDHPEQAKAWSGMITANVDAWQRRAARGVEILKADPHVDPARIAAIGYCFGGATVLQMAYAGMDLDGVVSFHGSLLPATEAQQKQIRAPILVAHGSADGFTPAEQIRAFQEALNTAGADWHMVVYGGAKHSFTNPGADERGMAGLAYDPDADRRSWRHMQQFFREVFGTDE